MANKFMSLIYWISVVTTDTLSAVRYSFIKTTSMVCVWHHIYFKIYQSLCLHVLVVISVSSLSCFSFLFLPFDVSFSFTETTSTCMQQQDATACIYIIGMYMYHEGRQGQWPNGPAQPQPIPIPMEVPDAQCWACPWYPLACPAPYWGSGMGPGCQALTWRTPGAPHCSWPRPSWSCWPVPCPDVYQHLSSLILSQLFLMLKKKQTKPKLYRTSAVILFEQEKCILACKQILKAVPLIQISQTML